MGKTDNQTSGAAGVQVFELTMNNPENQDELNRQLHKPGESDRGPPEKIGRTAQGESTTESAGKKKGTPSILFGSIIAMRGNGRKVAQGSGRCGGARHGLRAVEPLPIMPDGNPRSCLPQPLEEQAYGAAGRLGVAEGVRSGHPDRREKCGPSRLGPRGSALGYALHRCGVTGCPGRGSAHPRGSPGCPPGTGWPATARPPE